MKFNFETGNKAKEVHSYTPTIVKGRNINTTNSAFKGEVENDNTKFPKELGLKHPFDFSLAEKIWKGFGMVNAIVDKYIDFVVGPGFYVKTQSERAQKILEQFLKDTDFATLLRAWTKEALVKGTGFIEIGGSKNGSPEGLKVLDAKSMYIVRDKKGVIKGYNQYAGKLDKFNPRDANKVLKFETYQIACLALNKIGNDAYGQGIVMPSAKFIDMLVENEKSLQTILRRKANSPYHIKVGNDEYPASPDAVTAFGKDLTWLDNVHEWATDHLVEIKTVDTGNVSNKFNFPVEHNLDMLFFSYQVPEVLMGRGSIPEGLAQVQMEAFQRRIQSIQAELEKVIEQQILSRVLLGNGIQDSVEFEWGQPSDEEKNKRITQIQQLLSLMSLSPELRKQLEIEIASLMGLDADKVKEEMEKAPTDEELEETEQPRVPGQNSDTQQKYVKQNINDFDNLPIREWLDFDYQEYLTYILSSVANDNYTYLIASSTQEAELGKLTSNQVKALKDVLSQGFKENLTLKQISSNIASKVSPKSLFNEEGKLVLGADSRPMNIARTETTRLSAIGAEKAFAAKGVEEYQWVATASERTCPICDGMHGSIFKINSGAQKPPIHANCRCTIVPVVRG